MRFFKKRDRRYDNQQDRYNQKYGGTFMLGIVYATIGALGYLIYILFFE